MGRFIELPKAAEGLVMNNRTSDSHWGKPETVGAWVRIGRLWHQRFPNAPISIGQMSRRNGGPFPPHASHRLGIDTDTRPFRHDLKNLPVTYVDKLNYNPDLTWELIRMVRANAKVKLILFNDPHFIAQGLTQRYAGHDNHLHFRFLY